MRKSGNGPDPRETPCSRPRARLNAPQREPMSVAFRLKRRLLRVEITGGSWAKVNRGPTLKQFPSNRFLPSPMTLLRCDPSVGPDDRPIGEMGNASGNSASDWNPLFSGRDCA